MADIGYFVGKSSSYQVEDFGGVKITRSMSYTRIGRSGYDVLRSMAYYTGKAGLVGFIVSPKSSITIDTQIRRRTGMYFYD